MLLSCETDSVTNITCLGPGFTSAWIEGSLKAKVILSVDCGRSHKHVYFHVAC